MPNAIKVAIHGAAGRMGQRLVALGSADDELQITAALDAPHHPKLGEDAGLLAHTRSLGVPLTSEITQPVDVVIDFSIPLGAMSILKTCVAKKIPLVLATTGFTADEQNTIREAAKTIPLLWSPSMSMTVNLAMRLSEIAGRALAEHPGGADVEIIERHPRFKEDAPSGTALKFGDLI